MQDQRGLLERILGPKVPQELKEPDIPWQVALAHTPKHPEVGLEQGEQALRTILVHVTTCVSKLAKPSFTPVRK